MLTIRKLWTGLSKEGQGKVCDDLARFWRRLDKGSRKALAQAISFRERTFDATQLDRRARLLGRSVSRLGRRDLHAVLFQLRDIREELATDFDKATSRLGKIDAEEIIEEDIKKCIDRLTGRWSFEDIWLHVGTDYIRNSERGDENIERQKKIFRVLDETHTRQMLASCFAIGEDSPAASASSNEIQENVPELSSPDFTTLDNVLIRTIMSSMNHVEGVLDLDELDDLVGELAELNDARERSWFHRGFVDSLLQRKLEAGKPGDNVSRRAWYVTGHLVASMRSLPDGARPALLEKISSKDIALLKDARNGSAVQFLPLLLKPLLEQGEVEEANEWIAAHGEKRFKAVAEIVRDWAKSALFTKEIDPGKVRSVLDTTGQFFQQDIRNSKSVLENMDPKFVNRMDREIRYLRAVSFRMDGQLTPSDHEFKSLLEQESKEKYPSRIKDLWVQRALVKIGIRRLGDLHIPRDKEERKTFAKGILSAEAWLKKAVAGDNPSPIALVLTALPEVVSPRENGRASRAKANLDRAIDIMQPPGVQLWESGEGSLGEETHLLTKARFYSTLLDLRALEAAQAQGKSLVTRLQDLFQDDRFPSDLEIEAVEHALLIDAPGVAELAATILNRHGHEALRRLDIIEASTKSKHFRTSLIEMLDDPEWLKKLTPDERWNAWESLLKGCKRSDSRDAESAEHALDALQTLARQSSEISGKFMALLQDQESKVWSPAWAEEDRDDALYHCFTDHGEISQAVDILTRMAHREISNRNWGQADDLLDLVKRHDPEGDNLKQLRQRRDSEFAQEGPKPDGLESATTDSAPVSIVFVGGAEPQKRYESVLAQQFRDEHPFIRVSYHFTDWSSNWSHAVDKISNDLLEADAMVLMRLMRTGLGRRLRSLAGEHDKSWVSCTGHGRDSMKRSILEAVRVVRRQRSQAST